MSENLKTLRIQFLSSNLPWIGRVCALMLATALFYGQDLAAIANEIISFEGASYMLAVPVFLAYIIYRKRNLLLAVSSSKRTKQEKTIDEASGAILCLLAVILFLYGSYTYNPFEFHLLSFPVFLVGAVLILFNMKVLRALVFPVGLLFILSVLQLEIAYLAGAALSSVTSQISFQILKLLGFQAELGNPQVSPIVVLLRASDISIEFVIGFTTFAIFAAYVVRGTYARKIATLLIGFPLVFALNIIRVLLIMLIAYQFGQSIAVSVFHVLGWTLVFFGFLILLITGKRLLKAKILAPEKSRLCDLCKEDRDGEGDFCIGCGRLQHSPRGVFSKRDVIKTIALVLSVFLVVSARIPAFIVAENMPQLVLHTANGLETIQLLPSIPNYTLLFMYRDIYFEEMYEQEAAPIFAYTSKGEYPIVWVSLEISGAQGSLHDWDMRNYLHEQQGAFLRLDLRDIQLLHGYPLVARFESFEVIDTNLTQTFLYWVERAAFDVGSGIEWKYVKTSVWVDTYGIDFSSVEDTLLVFGKAIANYWQPAQSWSLLTFAFREHQLPIAAITTGFSGILLFLNIFKKENAKRKNMEIYRKLVDEDKGIVAAIQKAAKKGKATANAIARAYEYPIEHPELLNKLRFAEKAGLIKNSIMSVDDQPVLVWTNLLPNIGK